MQQTNLLNTPRGGQAANSQSCRGALKKPEKTIIKQLVTNLVGIHYFVHKSPCGQSRLFPFKSKPIAI
jgi:hypothetical protein